MPSITVEVQEFTDRAQRDGAVADLLSDGYAVQHDDERETILVRRPRFGTEQWMCVFYGMIFFIVPAAAYVLWWSARPVPVVIVRLAPAGTRHRDG